MGTPAAAARTRPPAGARLPAGWKLAAALAAFAALALPACSSSHPGARAATPAPSASANTSTSTAPQPTSKPAGATPSTPVRISAADWTTYQAGPSRLGVAPAQPTLTPLQRAWSASLDGARVFAQPLYAGGRVIVATEDDDVYALNPHDGAVEWRVSIGTPLYNVLDRAGCGDIDPLGITSTPAVDPATGSVYAVGEVSTGGRPPVHHQLVAIDIRTGRVVRTDNADPPLPPGEQAVALLQRESLALGNGRVYVGYGGNYGDCGTYHGWLVAIPAAPAIGSTQAQTGSRPPGWSSFDVTPLSTGGAIWGSGSAPAIGADGSVYVTTGNPNSGGADPWAEAAVKLPPGLGSAPEAVFKDERATGDQDLATGAPVLVPDLPGGGTEVFVTGKTELGYRLRQSDLGELAVVSGPVCGSDPDGGTAFDAALDALYVPCRGGGIQQVDLRRNATGWRAGTANSTPIMVAGALWAVSYPSGRLQELDPNSGRVLFTTGVGRTVPNFASPSAAHGLLLVPTDSGVVAFSGPSGPPSG